MIVIKVVNSEMMLNIVFAIRKKVFVEEQKVPEIEEIDQYENQATHYLVYFKNTPIATCRTRKQQDYLKIERFCVLKEFRGLKIGCYLMTFVEQASIKGDFNKFILSAQTQAIKFYEKLGYKICSKAFYDANIEHYMMEKQVAR